MNYIIGLFVFVALSQDVWSENRTIEIEGRIIGGTKVTSNTMYPYTASLLMPEEQQSGKYYPCGGSIISKKAILTAAHCLENMKMAYIRIGSTIMDKGGMSYKSSDFRIHPSFNSKNLDYDVAIIRLSTPMDLDGKTRKAIPLPKPDAAIPAGTTLTVIGWGATEHATHSLDLMKVDMVSITNEQCSKYTKGITPRMLCAGGNGKDAGKGDSGGPAVDKKTGVQLGVTSFGITGKPTYPGVYTRVAAVVTWIKQNAEM